MKTRVCGLMVVLYLIVLVKLVYGEVQQQEEVRVTLFNDVMCGIESVPVVGVIEGNDDSFQKALEMVYKNCVEYVAFVFYASRCPFSRAFRQKFSKLSSLNPPIPHLAIEESSIKPSIISKYGVHGFPTLFLMNSTMPVRYQAPRSLRSLVAFYSDVTGIRTAAHESTWICETNQEKQSQRARKLHIQLDKVSRGYVWTGYMASFGNWVCAFKASLFHVIHLCVNLPNIFGVELDTFEMQIWEACGAIIRKLT